MAEMDCESLLLEDGPGKYSEDSDGNISNTDEDALLADDTDFISIPKHSRIKFKDNTPNVVEQEPEDVLDLGTDLEDEDVFNRKSSNSMMVSSTTPTNVKTNVVYERKEERDTRFKQEREVTTSNKFAHIPDSLDDVVITNYSSNNQRNQKSFRGRGRGYNNNNNNNNYQRSKPESKTVLINPHFKGKVTVSNSKRLNWDARERLNQNYNNKNHVGHVIPPFIQQNQNQLVETNWNNVPNFQMQQPQQQPHFQQFMQQPQVPQQMYNQQPSVPLQHPQIPQQMLHTYQAPQQCFMQPLQDPYYSQPPQFIPPQFNHPPPQFQPPSHFQSDSQQYVRRMNPYGNAQFAVPQNQIQRSDQYPQQLFNQPMKHSNPSILLQPNHQSEYMDRNKPSNVQYQDQNINKRKVINNGVIRKVKRRNQVVSNNLQEVRTIQVPDTTVKDDEDEATKEYRKLIEEQKKKREQILQQKEARRRKAFQDEQYETISTLPQTIQEIAPVQQKRAMVLKTTESSSNRTMLSHHPNQRRMPVARKPVSSLLRKITPSLMHYSNPNIKVINVNDSNLEKQHLSSFLTNRKILAKDESLLDTNIVLISNLSNGTTSVNLRKMCVGIGDVKNLEMSPKERQATIQFNSVASAHAFFKKYQRTMLDLSMIQVTLKPAS